MPKKQSYLGYTNLSSNQAHRTNHRVLAHTSPRPTEYVTLCGRFTKFKTFVSKVPNTLFDTVAANKVLLLSVITLVLLSYAVPDLVRRLQLVHEMSQVHKITDLISSEVKSAESLCEKAVTKLCQLYCSVNVGDKKTDSENKNPDACTASCKAKRLPIKPRSPNTQATLLKKKEIPKTGKQKGS